ncbi:hypothetical protein W02_27270 [Nitrospira sp. KM1]|nr:hypothetical protein W02_27270 [Nitrospira sp. KM1]
MEAVALSIVWIYTVAVLRSACPKPFFEMVTADKLKVAASLHRKSMREYKLEVLETHLKELERKGVSLTLPKGEVGPSMLAISSRADPAPSITT